MPTSAPSGPVRTRAARNRPMGPRLTTRPATARPGRFRPPGSGPMTSAAALTVEHVVAGYGGVLALQDVSITASPGTITAVLGANGAGKTTLLATISGFVRPRQGQIRLDGTDLARRRPEEIVRAGVAHVPEGQAVITELTVEDNLRVGALRQQGRADRSRALAETYQRFPMLAKARQRSAGTLSGGERQILVIARALLT